MVPNWKFSGPPAPGRMIAGSATEPCSILFTWLNCCCRTVDLQSKQEEGKPLQCKSTSILPLCLWESQTYFLGETDSSSMVDSSSPSSPKWSLLFFCGSEKQ